MPVLRLQLGDAGSSFCDANSSFLVEEGGSGVALYKSGPISDTSSK